MNVYAAGAMTVQRRRRDTRRCGAPAVRLWLLLFASAGFAQTVLSQNVDSTRYRTATAGSVTVTNKGISTIPSFTLGKPAAIFDLSIARRGLSFEPQFRYGLDGKPWSFLFWGRYKVVDGRKVRMTVGAHPALNFKEIPVSVHQASRNVMVARRFLAAEIQPSYTASENVSVGAYYLYSYGVEQDVARNTHFLSLRTTLSSDPLLGAYRLRIVPQLYYLRADERDGFYLNAGLSVGRGDVPVSIGATVNRTIRTGIPGSEALLWNVSLSYSIH